MLVLIPSASSTCSGVSSHMRIHILWIHSCADPESSVRNPGIFEGFFFFFLVDEVIEDPKTSSPASETPFKWRFAGVPIMAKLVFL